MYALVQLYLATSTDLVIGAGHPGEEDIGGLVLVRQLNQIGAIVNFRRSRTRS